MDLIASFNSHKVRTFHFFRISGILKDEVLSFLFDTGAACSIVGVNNLVPGVAGDSTVVRQELERILMEEIRQQEVETRVESFRTASNDEIISYPCVCHNTSIEGSKSIDFYFDISMQEVNLPILGSNFLDECSYTHTIDGNVVISAIKPNPGSKPYLDRNLLNFNKVMDRYHSYLGQAFL